MFSEWSVSFPAHPPVSAPPVIASTLGHEIGKYRTYVGVYVIPDTGKAMFPSSQPEKEKEKGKRLKQTKAVSARQETQQQLFK